MIEACLFGVLLLAGLGAGLLLLPRRGAPAGGPASTLEAFRVSVVIPARNEEGTLPRLLQSINEGGVAGLEVLVVDDHSTDATAEVARRHRARVVSPGALPSGWTGKAWACQQGAQVAQGDVLVFLDADTFFEKGGLRRALEAHAAHDFQPLSFLPWHEPGSPAEELSLFFNVLMALGTWGEGNLCGQTLLIRREHYESAGGHGSVRGEILENLCLADRLTAIGLRPRCLAGKKILSMRMYPHGLGSLVEGWTKAFARGARRVSTVKMLTSIVWIVGLFSGFLGLGGSLLLRRWDAPVLAAAYVLNSFQLYVLSRRVGRFHLLSALLYPLPLVFFQGVFLRSVKVQASGAGARWKGRDVPTPSNQ